jgi:hypothetical protein
MEMGSLLSIRHLQPLRLAAQKCTRRIQHKTVQANYIKARLFGDFSNRLLMALINQFS